MLNGNWHFDCKIIYMKILLLSNDNLIQSILNKFEAKTELSVKLMNKGSTPLEILEKCYSFNPSLVIADDDLLKPNTVQILSSIRKVNHKTKIIFVTSELSLELGKKIAPIGIFFYAIKPIEESDFTELLNSILINKTKQYNSPY